MFLFARFKITGNVPSVPEFPEFPVFRNSLQDRSHIPYESHPDLITPPDTTVLWRYMDFARFIQMIESQTLWFSRLDRFEDPLEGGHTDAELAGIRKHVEQAEQLIGVFRAARKDTYVSCWRAGKSESLAMWDLYGRGSGIVAVKSTVGLLKEAVEGYGERVFISQVRYVDWSERSGLDNVLVACSRKDLSYQHEGEVRAILSNIFPPSETGIAVPVNINCLVTEIMVGPREKEWVVQLIEQVKKRYELPQLVLASDRLKPRP